MIAIPLQTWGQEIDINLESTEALILFIVYAGLMIGIGIWAGRRQSSEEDYYVAGRSIGSWVTALSIFAGVVSGWGMVANPGAVYAGGIVLAVIGIVTPIGMVIGYWLLGKKLRVLGMVKNAITAPDAVYYRYKDDRLRLLAIISVILGTIGFLAAQYAALGIVLAAVLPVGFLGAVLIGVAVIGIYTVIGGMLAAVWSDAIQGILMVFASVLAVTYIFTNIPGSFIDTFSVIHNNAPSLLHIPGTLPIGLTISLLLVTIFVGAQPHFFTKFYMTQDTTSMRWGALIAGSAGIITSMLIIIGLAMRAATIQGIVQVQNPDVVLPLALLEFTPSFIAAFILVGAASAIMSTSNAMLNIAAATITHDFIQKYLGKDLSNTDEVLYGRITTVIILIASMILAATSSGLIVVLGAAGLGIFLTVFVPTVLIGYNWKNMTAEGTLIGGSVGLVFILVVTFANQYYGYQLPANFVPAEVAVMISLFLSILISFVTTTSTYQDLDDPDMRLVLDIPRMKNNIYEASETVTRKEKTTKSDDD